MNHIRVHYTSVNLMISPLLRQSFLLSSSTVFMFSIQTASTGPSNTYHFLSGVSLATPALINEARIPSVLKNEKDSFEKFSVSYVVKNV